jgi:hypothetical protein
MILTKPRRDNNDPPPHPRALIFLKFGRRLDLLIRILTPERANFAMGRLLEMGPRACGRAA